MTKQLFKNTIFGLASVCLLVFGGTLISAADKTVEYTSVQQVFQDESAQQDFRLQGEYTAEYDGQKLGLQLIADGGGKFRSVVYIGGLPGDGWNPGELRIFGKAEISGENGLKIELAKTNPQYDSISTPQKLEAIFKIEQREQSQREQNRRGLRRLVIETKYQGNSIVFTKTARRSSTFNAKAPEGAAVLFDGTNLDQFLPGARINETEGRLGKFLWSEAQTKPFDIDRPYALHIEFLTSYMPTARGQGRSNSGVYINEAYECQVLDSFGLELANNECGGFYQIKAPDVNVSYPPLTWQTYDIDFVPPKYDGDKKVTNAKVSVKQNGVTIHKDLELPHQTPGRKDEKHEPRGLYLQGHGNNVQYRNIWLKYND
ncbi:MAG: DUF1080 domain-containing protein [Planctomycetaceae bacterium]|jgi:hypothetical protein|nr:DUF1080 domain-containing protein [Planctomycetaceae bacterium]